MLTEIDWWGGLIFLWWALSFWFLLIATKWVKYGFQYSYTVGALILTATTLALFFYPLEAPWIKILYLTATALGAVCVGLLGFYPEHDDAIETAESVLEMAVDDLDHSAESNNHDADNPDEDEKLELLGNITLLGPFAIILFLSLIRSWQLIQSFG